MSRRSGVVRLVTFRVGEAWYAADIAHVERVLEHGGAQSIPHMPPWMEGIIEHLGRIIPVVNLRQRFGAGSAGSSTEPSRRLLLLTLGDEVIAAAVDRVVDVRAVAPEEIAPPPALVQGITGDFLRGLVRRNDALVLVLDVTRLFSTDDRAMLSQFALVGTGFAAGGLVAAEDAGNA